MGRDSPRGMIEPSTGAAFIKADYNCFKSDGDCRPYPSAPFPLMPPEQAMDEKSELNLAHGL